MNDKEYVREHMKTKTEQIRDGKFRLTIDLVYSADTDCPLSVNGAPMNAGKPGEREAKWLGASRFVMQMIELFSEDMRRYPIGEGRA